MTISIPLRELTYGPCPYLEQGRRPGGSRSFPPGSFLAGAYEHLLSRGFRRSGTSFYRTTCEGCDRCIPIRIDAEQIRAHQIPAQGRPDRTPAPVFSYDDRGLRIPGGPVPALRGVLPGSPRQGPCDPEEGALSYLAFLVDSPLGVRGRDGILRALRRKPVRSRGTDTWTCCPTDFRPSTSSGRSDVARRSMGIVFHPPGDRALPYPRQAMVLPRVSGCRAPG
ncbi:MAG: hypothetical protein MZV70_05810 [Desulfobacterales bacterium]|nr:hypothetical protein [Desulfobacterales bacterium]